MQTKELHEIVIITQSKIIYFMRSHLNIFRSYSLELQLPLFFFSVFNFNFVQQNIAVVVFTVDELR